MKPTPYLISLNQSHRIAFSFARALQAPVCLLTLTTLVLAKPIPENLGYGLDKLVESQVAVSAAAGKGPKAQAEATKYNGYATEQAADYAARAITESETGRVKIDAFLGGDLPLAKVSQNLAQSIPSWTMTAADASYRSTGIVEGFVSVEDVPALAKIKGVRSVFLALKPELDSLIPENTSVSPKATRTSTKKTDVVAGDILNKIGTAFDQGVTQHRVDKINQIYNPNAPVNYDGSGISIAAMSDSFDKLSTAPNAPTGVTNGDLPGAGNPINSQPVIVLKDEDTRGTDEGRAMIEIIHKMAPRAKLAYATGVDGEVAFANYIRSMAGIPGYENTFPSGLRGFKADVIVDDISYGGEPFYGESIIGGGVDDAAAVGVSYFSSAGNNVGINAYESALRIVPNGTGLTAAAGNTALANTNINLANVPAGLYAGGFHNFKAGGLDVACLWNMPTSTATGATEMQWDDPYDIRTPMVNQPPIFSGTGTTNGTFNGTSNPKLPQFTAGTGYVITETATSGDFDGIVSITDPNGTVVVNQDTGTDESVTFFASVSGQYSIAVAPYSTTKGNFSLTVNTTDTPGLVTSDLNLLVFRTDTGAYLGDVSLTTNNIANNRPVELGTIYSPEAQTQLQFVIARSNTPTAPQLPTRVRVSTRGNGAAGIGPAEYFTYNAVTTKGHATAAGGNGVAAYSPFRPNIPESFTSPGPATIFFDKNANRLATPIVRLQPTVAAIDGANTSFFSSDSASDPDAMQNFSGTSAAAPHAAAIAGLVLQAHGGPGQVTPAQMRSVLQRSAFLHDLDPSYASASVKSTNGGKITLTIGSDNDTNGLTGQNDPNSIALSYVGPGAINSITFNPNGLGSEGGLVTGGNNGVQDNKPVSTVTYFANSYPGLVFLPGTKAFTLGSLTGLTPADITAPVSTSPYTGFSNLAPAPSNGSTHFYTMTIGFPTGNFTGGKVMRFTVGRGAQHSSNVASGTGPTFGTTTVNPIADVFGGGVFIPDGYVVQDGMKFSGTTTGGGTFTGTIRNRIGAGYTPVDGYGLINAETAVSLPLQ